MDSNRVPLESDHSLYQDAELLIALRNGLVHGRPEWHTPGQPFDDVEKLGERLNEKQFSPSPFILAEGNAYFPDKCLSYGCAKWAVESSISFADGFYSRIGLIPKYDSMRSDLSV